MKKLKRNEKDVMLIFKWCDMVEEVEEEDRDCILGFVCKVERVIIG